MGVEVRNMRWFWKAFLLGCVLGCCAGCSERYDADYAVGIDPRFSAADEEVVLEAISSWRTALGPTFRLQVSIRSCDLGDGDATICVHPTTIAENDARREEGNVAGDTERSGVSDSSDVYLTIDRGPLTWKVATHELGHAFGLQHTGPGTVMCGATACASSEISCEDVRQFWSLRGAAGDCSRETALAVAPR